VRVSLSVPLTMAVSDQRDHLLGPPDAPVTLLEYGDFECPHCGEAHGMLGELMTAAQGRFRLAYRHFPLSEVHPHARDAAEAAELAAAARQFWPMHDTLFTHQDALEAEDLVAYAATVGLDPSRFADELAAGAASARVREDFMSGVRSGVNGTPTFFLNGLRYDGPHDLDAMQTAVEAAASSSPSQRGAGRAGRRRPGRRPR
jgi:protein-disulfide isomerase